jgi:hypothetical protein
MSVIGFLISSLPAGTAKIVCRVNRGKIKNLEIRTTIHQAIKAFSSEELFVGKRQVAKFGESQPK